MELIEKGEIDKDAEATAKFCKIINDLFDLMNSKRVNEENLDAFLNVYVLSNIIKILTFLIS